MKTNSDSDSDEYDSDFEGSNNEYDSDFEDPDVAKDKNVNTENANTANASTENANTANASTENANTANANASTENDRTENARTENDSTKADNTANANASTENDNNTTNANANTSNTQPDSVNVGFVLDNNVFRITKDTLKKLLEYLMYDYNLKNITIYNTKITNEILKSVTISEKIPIVPGKRILIIMSTDDTNILQEIILKIKLHMGIKYNIVYFTVKTGNISKLETLHSIKKTKTEDTNEFYLGFVIDNNAKHNGSLYTYITNHKSEIQMLLQKYNINGIQLYSKVKIENDDIEYYDTDQVAFTRQKRESLYFTYFIFSSSKLVDTYGFILSVLPKIKAGIDVSIFRIPVSKINQISKKALFIKSINSPPTTQKQAQQARPQTTPKPQQQQAQAQARPQPPRPRPQAQARPQTTPQQQPRPQQQQPRPQTTQKQRPQTTQKQRPQTTQKQRPQTTQKQRPPPTPKPQQRPQTTPQQQPQQRDYTLDQLKSYKSLLELYNRQSTGGTEDCISKGLYPRMYLPSSDHKDLIHEIERLHYFVFYPGKKNNGCEADATKKFQCLSNMKEYLDQHKNNIDKNNYNPINLYKKICDDYKTTGGKINTRKHKTNKKHKKNSKTRKYIR